MSALVAGGATYFSDEYAVLDAEGAVPPYPRRLSIRSTSGTTQERDVSDFGGVATQMSCDVGAVLITRYVPDATGELEARSAGEGVLALMANTVPAQMRPRETLATLTRGVRGATILEGERPDASEFAPRRLVRLRSHDRAGTHDA